MHQGADHNRRLPNVVLPGQSSSSSSFQHIKTGVPDITLNTRRDITGYESGAWIPRTDQASKIVTTFLRHGSSDTRFNVYSPDGYVRVAILVQLHGFKKHNIDAKILEVIMMHGRARLMMSADQTKIKAIQAHTLDILDYNKLYEKILSIPFFELHPMWGGNPPDM